VYVARGMVMSAMIIGPCDISPCSKCPPVNSQNFTITTRILEQKRPDDYSNEYFQPIAEMKKTVKRSPFDHKMKKKNLDIAMESPVNN
jgi:hypothetical protein